MQHGAAAGGHSGRFSALEGVVAKTAATVGPIVRGRFEPATAIAPPSKLMCRVRSRPAADACVVQMRNFELEEENARLRALLESGASAPAVDEEQLNFYIQKVAGSLVYPVRIPVVSWWLARDSLLCPQCAQLEAELAAAGAGAASGGRVVFHSEQCLDGNTLYGYPSKMEPYRCGAALTALCLWNVQ